MALGVLLFIGSVNKAGLRYEADRKTIKLDMTYLDRQLRFTSDEQRQPMVQYVLSQCLNRNPETRWTAIGRMSRWRRVCPGGRCTTCHVRARRRDSYKLVILCFFGSKWKNDFDAR